MTDFGQCYTVLYESCCRVQSGVDLLKLEGKKSAAALHRIQLASIFFCQSLIDKINPSVWTVVLALMFVSNVRSV